MIKIGILGASGYSGAALTQLIHHHPHFEAMLLGVSATSADAGRAFSELHGTYRGVIDTPLIPIDDSKLHEWASQLDAVFLATPHQASAQWVPKLVEAKVKVFDLSGAFRLSAPLTNSVYGINHTDAQLASEAVYGLAEWHRGAIADASLVAVPGCYPTASILALKPLMEAGLIDVTTKPIINAVSGVSGAGRKAALSTSFCEVSLQAYGVLNHRHQPEISQSLGTDVIFTPHLGNFQRGILATLYARLKHETTPQQVHEAYHKAYDHAPLIRLLPTMPKLADVVHSPYCDINWQQQGQDLIIGSAIDNLLKGAAAQALQCANIAFGLDKDLGLVGGAL